MVAKKAGRNAKLVWERGSPAQRLGPKGGSPQFGHTHTNQNIKTQAHPSPETSKPALLNRKIDDCNRYRYIYYAIHRLGGANVGGGLKDAESGQRNLYGVQKGTQGDHKGNQQLSQKDPTVAHTSPKEAKGAQRNSKQLKQKHPRHLLHPTLQNRKQIQIQILSITTL
jgi:hypothetical protein